MLYEFRHSELELFAGKISIALYFFWKKWLKRASILLEEDLSLLQNNYNKGQGSNQDFQIA